MIKHLIFDFGGVFLDLGGEHSGIPGQLAEVLAVSLEQTQKIWKTNRERLLKGQETPEEFLVFMNKELNLTVDIQEALRVWKKHNKLERKHINWRLVQFIEKLKKNYSIHMLSDTIDLDTGADEWIHEITDHFDNIYKSYDIKQRKPDPEAFLYILRAIKAKPQECIFIDDFLPNVQAAESLGIKSFLYTDMEQLYKDFRRHSLEY